MTSYIKEAPVNRKCGLYVRVSTDRQITEEGSLKSQVQRLEEELKRRSDNGARWIATKVYVEEGASGKDMNRPKLKEMIGDIKAGAIDTVLCTELSRLSRSVMDFLNFAQFLQESNVGFVCLKQNFDTVSPAGRMMITVCMALAQFERELTAERTTENLLARSRRGLRNGGQVLGYDVDPNRRGYLIPSPDEAPVVNRIFDRYLELGSMELVAREMNKAGFRTKAYLSKSGHQHKPHKFSKQFINWTLTNRSYIGQIEINRTSKAMDQQALPEAKRYAIVPAVWPAIVSEAKFTEVNRLMRKNGQIKKSAAKRVAHNFVLRGLVQCATCESNLENGSGTSKDGTMHFYYRHGASQRREDCTLPALRAQGLEKIVISRLGYLAERKDIIEAIAEQANLNLGNEAPKVMAILGERKRELVRINREIEVWVQKILELDSASVKELVEPRVEELKKLREQVKEEIFALQRDLDGLKGNVVSTLEIQEMLQSFDILYQELPPHKQQELMGLIVSQIRVMTSEIEMALFGRASLERFRLSGTVFAQRQNWLRD